MAKHFVQVLKRHFPKTMTLNSFSSFVNSEPKSSLFISGKRAKDTFVVVIPYLELENRFASLGQLEDNIKRRRLDLNLTDLKALWEFYREWNKKKAHVEENLDITGKQMNDLLKTMKSQEINENEKPELVNLRRIRTLLKEELHNIRENVWEMEDNVIGKLLKLPNDLHPETPDSEEELFSYDKETLREGFDHLDIGKKLNCLEYQNAFTYFLKDKAALFELAVPEMFVSKFIEKGFIRFSNPDSTRSVLAEGVTLNPRETHELFLLEQTEGNNDHLYLCGGASLFPFCGYHAKQSVPKKSLPVKYIASGRRYTPTALPLPGLYSVCQSTSVQLFIATHNEAELINQFQSCVEGLQDIYTAIGLNFKVVKLPPHCLKHWESLCVSLQVFSPRNNDFVEVGNVSLIDDFVSKRLRMCYGDKNDLFLKVISGTVVNTQVLLALCLERSFDNLFVPGIVKDHLCTYMLS